MKLEQQVTNLELSKRLKKLGVKQESHFWWIKSYSDNEFVIANPTNKLVSQADAEMMEKDFEYYSAFTVGELGELLPKELLSHRHGNMVNSYLLDTRQNYGKGWYIRYLNAILEATIPSDIPFVDADTEADARAKMIIYLLENGLLTNPL